MNATTDTIDRAVLDTLRESGAHMTAAELSYEVGLDIGATEQSLHRLIDQRLVRGGGFGEGGFTARSPR